MNSETTLIPGLRPAATAASVTRYGPARHGAPVDLDLASTVIADQAGARAIAGSTTDSSRGTASYPDCTSLAARLAAEAGIGPARVLVTAGADEALERAFRAMLAPGDEVVLTTPTFEMLPRYARLIGAVIREVAWETGPLPVQAIGDATTDRTRLIVVVSPNNPTGTVASLEELRAVTDAAPAALLLVDLAYVEFAASDPTEALLREPRVAVVRTFSKAWGLPGIRIGWAAGPAEVIEWMRTVGNPYTVSTPSVALAERALDSARAARAATIASVHRFRDRLFDLLRELELDPLPSQANFVCATPDRAPWLRDALAGLGVAVRLLPAKDRDRLRVTCPADDAAWQRLEHALRTALRPEALIFDMDGVLADVSGSYRQAIIASAASFGVAVTPADIAEAKAAGNANDDWQLTTRIVSARGVTASFDEVKRRFEAIYQGESGRPGLRDTESLLLPADTLRALASRFKLGIATGRPSADAERFLAATETTECFACCVAKEDGAIKPDPFPVAEAMRRLGVTRAWMIGDTPDDIRSARSAGALPVGVLPPGDTGETLEPALIASGAAWVLPAMTAFEEILP